MLALPFPLLKATGLPPQPFGFKEVEQEAGGNAVQQLAQDAKKMGAKVGGTTGLGEQNSIKKP